MCLVLSEFLGASLWALDPSEPIPWSGAVTWSPGWMSLCAIVGVELAASTSRSCHGAPWGSAALPWGSAMGLPDDLHKTVHEGSSEIYDGPFVGFCH